jgi:sugar lactone lactonase YvrE
MKATIKYMLAASALAVLAACGDGGGDDAPITPSGTVTTLAGDPSQQEGGDTDATGALARFNTPRAVAVDSSGNVYVADWGNATIRKITSAGVVTTLAGAARQTGSTDGTGAAARFGSTDSDLNVIGPEGIAVDASGNVYVADTPNQVIRKITIVGDVVTVTTLAGTVGESGYRNSADGAPLFSGPNKLAVDSSGNLYVADSGNSVVRKITIDGGGATVTTFAGTAGQYGYMDGADGTVRFGGFSGIAVDSSGNVYVSDPDYSTIRKITRAGDVVTVMTLAGTPGEAMSTADFSDGIGAAAKFSNPQGVAVDASGNVYVADFNNQAIRKITPAGEVTTFAGAPDNYSGADGIGAAAGITMPSGIAVGSDGYIYVVCENHTVRKIAP